MSDEFSNDPTVRRLRDELAAMGTDLDGNSIGASGADTQELLDKLNGRDAGNPDGDRGIKRVARLLGVTVVGKGRQGETND